MSKGGIESWIVFTGTPFIGVALSTLLGGPDVTGTSKSKHAHQSTINA